MGLPALAIDLPGHGDSSWRDDAVYTGRALAPDIAAAITAWTDRPQVVVGQSLGGLTGAALAASHPDLVRELIVVDITPGIDPNGGAAELRKFFAGPTDWASREELVDRALAFGLGGTREAATKGVLLNSRVRPDGRVEWKHHFARLANALASDADAAAEHDRQQDGVARVLAASGWDDLAGVIAPLTLVRGTRGYLTDADRDTFAERVPQATIVELDAPHNVQEQRPTELAALVVDAAARGTGNS